MTPPKAEKLASGLWRARVMVRGKRVAVYGETEAECQRNALAEKMDLTHPQVGSLGDLIDRYIERVSPQLSVSTVRGYRMIRKHRLQNYMDERPDSIDFQAALNAESVAPKTLKNTWALVSASLKGAGYRPPVVRLAQVPVPDEPYLDPEEIAPFLRAIYGKPFEFAALLELNGLRYSEMRAMTPDRIRNGRITVSGAVVRGEKGMVYKETNKTKKSHRTLPVLIPRIEEIGWGRVDFAHRNLAEWIGRACDEAGVTRCRNHDLRRSFASLCYYLEISPQQVAEWGGWENVETITRFYARLAQSAKNAAAIRVREFFEASLNGPMRAKIWREG